jgi:hypothetical protein
MNHKIDIIPQVLCYGYSLLTEATMRAQDECRIMIGTEKNKECMYDGYQK